MGKGKNNDKNKKIIKINTCLIKKGTSTTHCFYILFMWLAANY